MCSSLSSCAYPQQLPAEALSVLRQSLLACSTDAGCSRLQPRRSKTCGEAPSNALLTHPCFAGARHGQRVGQQLPSLSLTHRGPTVACVAMQQAAQG